MRERGRLPPRFRILSESRWRFQTVLLRTSAIAPSCVIGPQITRSCSARSSAAEPSVSHTSMSGT